MKSHDGTQLGAHLTRLAETFDRKPLTAEAMKVWFDTLKEFPAEVVFGMLSTWPRMHVKFPVPADVWKVINEAQIADRERAAAQLAAEARQPVHFSRTTGGKQALNIIRQILEQPKLSPREHWHKILSTHPHQSIGQDYATAALGKLNRGRRDRRPGEDAEEAA